MPAALSVTSEAHPPLPLIRKPLRVHPLNVSAQTRACKTSRASAKCLKILSTVA